MTDADLEDAISMSGLTLDADEIREQLLSMHHEMEFLFMQPKDAPFLDEALLDAMDHFQHRVCLALGLK